MNIVPKISVVMPAYNAERYIAEAIESILNQTFTDFEFIIINDGSTDRTKEIINYYSDPRIVLLDNEKNSGIVVTLNKGLDVAKGEYIARMDADDVAAYNRLEKQFAFLQSHPDIGVLGTGLRKFGEGIEESVVMFSTNPDQLKAELIFTTCIAHPTVMLRRSILEKHHIRYQLEYGGAEDFLLWWQLSQITRITTLPEVLLNYRIHDKQITHEKGEKRIDLLSRLLDLRFSDIGFTPNKNQKDIFLQYCIGKFKNYTAETLKQYICVLQELITKNKKTLFFKQCELQKVLSFSVLRCMIQSEICKDDKKECYRFAVSKGLFPYSMRLKVLYHLFL